VLLSIFFFGALGLIVGSFLNVVILRFGEKSVGGRSTCPSCNTQLRWYDLIPVLSWISLRGRCRSCHARISVQYPLVEAATAIFFALIAGAGLPLYAMAVALTIISLLICIFVYDLYHKLIPDAWVWAFCILALVYAVFSFEFLVFSLLAGPLAALPIFFLWALSYPFAGFVGAWMGFGDVKLALGIGWLLPLPTVIGLPLGLVAVFFAFIIGAVISACILLPFPHYVRWSRVLLGRAHATRLVFLCPVGGRRDVHDVDKRDLPTMASNLDHTNLDAGYTMKSEVPFGPFLIASCVLVWLSVLYNVHIPFSL